MSQPVRATKTIYVRAGLPFIPAPYCAYLLINKPPVDFSYMSPPPMVYYQEPGVPTVWVESWSLGPVVILPASASGQTAQSPPQQPLYVPPSEQSQPVYIPQPQPPIVVQPSPPTVIQPPQHQRMEPMEPRQATCPTCGGRGKLTCAACNGMGGHPCIQCGQTGKMVCPFCEGSGKTGDTPLNCTQCGGRGKVDCIKCLGAGTTPCSVCSSHFTRNGWELCKRCNGTGTITR